MKFAGSSKNILSGSNAFGNYNNNSNNNNNSGRPMTSTRGEEKSHHTRRKTSNVNIKGQNIDDVDDD